MQVLCANCSSVEYKYHSHLFAEEPAADHRHKHGDVEDELCRIHSIVFENILDLPL